MKKIIVVCVVTALLVGALPVTAGAAPAADLATLARYVPANAPLYAALRTDDGFIDELEAIRQKLLPVLSDDFAAGFSVQDALDEMVRNMTDGAGTFETVIRPWLGETAAVAIPTPQALMMSGMAGDLEEVLIAVSITDRAALEIFLGTVLPADAYTVDKQDGVTLYTPRERRGAPTIAVHNDVVLVGSRSGMVTGLPRESLADSAEFNAALDLLPASDYSAVLYVNVWDLAGSMTAMMMQGAETSSTSMFLEAVGPMALGFTILDGRSLAMDVAQTIDDTTALEEAGIWRLSDLPPVDLGFAARIPADAPLVIQGTDLGPMALAQFAVLRAYGDFIRANPGLFAGPNATADEIQALASFDVGHIATFVNLAFAGMTGLNLEKDVLPWMKGNAALFARIVPDDALGYALSFVPDVTFVTETANAGDTEAVMAAFGEALTAYDIAHGAETIGEADVLVLPDVVTPLFPEAQRAQVRVTDQLDLLMGVNADVFAAGTRAGTAFALAPADGGLAENPAFAYATASLLEGAESVWYLGVGPLLVYLDDLSARMDLERASPSSMHDVATAKRVLALFESGTASTFVTDEGDTVSRLVLTLAP